MKKAFRTLSLGEPGSGSLCNLVLFPGPVVLSTVRFAGLWLSTPVLLTWPCSREMRWVSDLGTSVMHSASMVTVLKACLRTNFVPGDGHSDSLSWAYQGTMNTRGMVDVSRHTEEL